LQTDALRRELLGPRTANDAVIEGFDEGRYAPAHRQRVYEEMLSRAAARLADRESVILDGTFLAAELLRRAAAMGNDARAAVLVVRCHCPDEVARTRVAARLAAGGDLSEARPELFDRQRLALEAVADGIANVEVDTTRSLAEQVAAVIERLRSLVAA
ncbi:MAG TPA: AAA family ATPase, partial [Pirellulales bacterium]|nr:AAA family ATPase [Pirellulales bacterium]